MNDEKILKPAEADAMCALSATSRRALVREGKFPKPVKLGTYRRGFLRSEVLEWIRQRADEREGKS